MNLIFSGFPRIQASHRHSLPSFSTFQNLQKKIDSRFSSMKCTHSCQFVVRRFEMFRKCEIDRQRKQTECISWNCYASDALLLRMCGCGCAFVPIARWAKHAWYPLFFSMAASVFFIINRWRCVDSMIRSPVNIGRYRKWANSMEWKALRPLTAIKSHFSTFSWNASSCSPNEKCAAVGQTCAAAHTHTPYMRTHNNQYSRRGINKSSKL